MRALYYMLGLHHPFAYAHSLGLTTVSANHFSHIHGVQVQREKYSVILPVDDFNL